MANRLGDSIVIFAGGKSASHISERRFIFDLEKGGWFANVGEIFTLVTNDEGTVMPMGRFCLKREPSSATAGGPQALIIPAQ